MKAIFATLTLVATLATLPAFAAQDRGGGSAVVCFDAAGAISSVTVLDLFEAKERLAGTLDLGPASLSYTDKLKYVANRLRKVDTVMAARIAKAADDFPKRVAFLKRSLIPDIHDRGEYLKPKSCAIGQMAAHIIDPRPLEKKYIVDVDLWNKADNDSRAALVIHEIVWEQARVIGETVSDNARYYTGVISSKEIANFSAKEYYKMIGQLCWIDPDENRPFYEQTGECNGPVGDRSTEQKDHIDDMISVTSNGIPLFISTVKFDDAGHATEGITARTATTHTPKGAIVVPDRIWVYFKNGRLTKISPMVTPITIYGKTYSTKTILYIYIDAAGNVTFEPLKSRQS